ncbi:MAG: hypothetical protein PVF83_10105 [Anaerolineales bacterium]|jgi:hypothetical protein
MNKKKSFPILKLIVIETFCTGLGMGVPFMNILLGFPLGWYITRQVSLEENNLTRKLNRILKYAVSTSALTFVFMLGVWGWTTSMLFDPTADIENFGHPFILFDPRLSFIGWLVLMIFISPFLRLLTTIFGAFLSLTFNQRE